MILRKKEYKLSKYRFRYTSIFNYPSYRVLSSEGYNFYCYLEMHGKTKRLRKKGKKIKERDNLLDKKINWF